jgi:hypothetical protein
MAPLEKVFVKCDIHLGFYSWPALKPIHEEKGREEFDNVGQ